MYDYGGSSLITDRTRVYKGGAWEDRAYWLNPGTRRFLDQSQSSDAIGFRCAMDRVGDPKSQLGENQRKGTDYNKKR
jgi:formylglycine-generating enzyme required for sulfatase activity